MLSISSCRALEQDTTCSQLYGLDDLGSLDLSRELNGLSFG